MLNIGQIVYDTTNDRVLFFCGLEMYAPKDGTKCYSIEAFINEEGTFTEYDSRKNKVPFTVTNLVKNGKPYSGSAIAELGCANQFFGIIDGTNTVVRDAAIKAIQNMKEEIAIDGIRKEKATSCNRTEYTKVILGKKAEKVSKL